MTARERSFAVAGLLLGVIVAAALFGILRFVRPGASAAPMDAAAEVRSAEGAAVQASAHEHPTTDAQPSDQTDLPSAVAEAQPSVQLSEEEQQSIGLQTTEVRRRNLRRDLLVPARVEEAETQLTNISARVGGRIDKLYADFTGQFVRRGQPIALIYSPDVLSSAEEYRLALESRKRLSSAAEAEAVSGADEVVFAARRRLELWGLTGQQIDEIGRSDKPQIDLAIYSPTSGIVTERKVTQGQYVNTGEVLYTVTDLSNVWVKADVYEADLPAIRVGQGVEITSESLPGKTLRGRVGFIEPMVNAQTRTTAARVQVANPGMRLRPGMFVQARFALPMNGSTLAVPRSSVLDTGNRKIVYLAKGNGVFEAREIQTGPPGGEYYPVLSGLKEGLRVVTQGNFLLDSQTRLSGGMSGMFGGSKEFEDSGSKGTGKQSASPAPKVTFRCEPASPKAGDEASLHVGVADSQGRPVSDAQAKVTFFMPAMPAMGMGEMRESSTLTWTGSEYSGTIKAPMSGTWTATVEVSRDGKLLTSYRTSVSTK
jgi:multidrug efflux pump subunit AcrA (membrane-fusion protein)